MSRIRSRKTIPQGLKPCFEDGLDVGAAFEARAKKAPNPKFIGRRHLLTGSFGRCVFELGEDLFGFFAGDEFAQLFYASATQVGDAAEFAE